MKKMLNKSKADRFGMWIFVRKCKTDEQGILSRKIQLTYSMTLNVIMVPKFLVSSIFFKQKSCHSGTGDIVQRFCIINKYLKQEFNIATQEG